MRVQTLGTVVIALGLAMSGGFALAQDLPSRAALSRMGLERAWTGQATLNPSRDEISHFVIDEDTVYVQASSGVTTAFDAETGRQLWAVQLGSLDDPSFPAVSNEELVMIVVGANVHALERRSGKLQWRLRLPGVPSSAPAVDDRQIYVGMLDGSVYAFSLRKVRELQLENKLPRWSYETLVWRYQASLEITSPPISNGRSVSFASRDGSLYSVGALQRELIYQFQTDAPILAPIAIADGILYIGSEDFTVFALDARNGRVKWQYTSGLPIRRRPFAIQKNLYLLPERGGLVSIDGNTGERKWVSPSITSFVGITQDAVFGSDEDNNLLKLNRADGQLMAQMVLRQYPVRVSNDRTDRLFFASSKGHILALRPTGRNLPLYHQHPERQPILPEMAPEAEPPAAGLTGDEGNPFESNGSTPDEGGAGETN